MSNGSDEVFLMTLSNARKNSAQSARAYRQFSEAAESVALKRDLESWASMTENDVRALDQCFEKIGENPVDLPFSLQEVFAPDLTAELTQMQTSMGKQLFILIKATELALRSMAGYPSLISVAQEMGRFDVSALLEAIVARRLTFIQRNQSLAQDLIDGGSAQVSRSAAIKSVA
jgi:ferritin-like metal-binding protein YciE